MFQHFLQEKWEERRKPKNFKLDVAVKLASQNSEADFTATSEWSAKNAPTRRGLK